MKVDILAIGVHPDDVELGCGGAILASVKKGKKVAVVDLTRGELGTRGTAESRTEEAAAAAKILKLTARENLELEDGFFQINQENLIKVIKVIRKYQPNVLICNAPEDRHPDHGRSAKLVLEASFLAGLLKIETSIDNQPQKPWRPTQIFQYIQDQYLEPDLIFDISEVIDEKEAAILSYTTQFNSKGDGPQTYISNPVFMETTRARALVFGKRIGVRFGEGFIARTAIGITSFDNIFTRG